MYTRCSGFVLVSFTDHFTPFAADGRRVWKLGVLSLLASAHAVQLIQIPGRITGMSITSVRSMPLADYVQQEFEGSVDRERPASGHSTIPTTDDEISELLHTHS